MEERYNHLNNYLKNRFGERVLKVCVDAGFTCPNRDGSVATGGCVFCGEKGAGENIKSGDKFNRITIENQIINFLNSYRGERANKFIVYFQSFTNTYASLEVLKDRYTRALNVSDKLIGLQVATRPDCINEDICKLLHSFSKKYYVCVELGFQTASDEIGNIINRGYTTKDFIDACNLLKKYNIEIVGHLMVGLPNEKEMDILNTADIISKYCNGIKIHSTYVLENTRLEVMYRRGEYQPITLEYYVDKVAKIIERLKGDVIIHRITADPPKDNLVAPTWTLRKKIVLNAINNTLKERGIHQGKKCSE